MVSNTKVDRFIRIDAYFSSVFAFGKYLPGDIAYFSQKDLTTSPNDFFCKPLFNIITKGNNFGFIFTS